MHDGPTSIHELVSHACLKPREREEKVDVSLAKVFFAILIRRIEQKQQKIRYGTKMTSSLVSCYCNNTKEFRHFTIVVPLLGYCGLAFKKKTGR